MEKTNNTSVTVTTDDNRVTQDLLMDYLKTMNKGLTEQQTKQFLAVAGTFGLNPWKREVYAVTFKNRDGSTEMSIVTGYETYIKRAELNPNYDGFDIEFKGSFKKGKVTKQGRNGTWQVDGIVPDGDVSCICTVYRKDRAHPTREEVFFDEYDQGNSMWQSKPRTMLKKVAIVSAFRKAFPLDFGGMPYASEELPDEMNGRNDLNSKGYQEVVVEQNAVPATDHTLEPPKEKYDHKDPKASLLVAVKTYNTKQFAAMLQMFANKDDEAHSFVVEKLKENGWTTPKAVPSDRYKDVVEWFYMAKDGGVVAEAEPAAEEVNEQKVDTEEVPF